MTDAPYVRPDVAAFLAAVNASTGPTLPQMGHEAARALTTSLRPNVDLPRGDLAICRDLDLPGPAGAIPARLYDAAPSRPPGPVMVYFHGGGFVLGDLDSHDGAVAEMTRALDMPVVAIDYRRAPEHPWPAAPQDAEAAARAVAAGAVEGVRPSGLVLAGDSAGGTLTIATAMALRDAPAAVPVLAQWPIYPLVDSRSRPPSAELFKDRYFLSDEEMGWMNRCYRGDPTDRTCSPGRFDQAGMPPTLVLTAGLDPLRDQGRAYAAQLAQAGVPVVFREAVGTIHCFLQLRRVLPSAVGDLAGALVALKAIVVEAEATRAMAAAA